MTIRCIFSDLSNDGGYQSPGTRGSSSGSANAGRLVEVVTEMRGHRGLSVGSKGKNRIGYVKNNEKKINPLWISGIKYGRI